MGRWTCPWSSRFGSGWSPGSRADLVDAHRRTYICSHQPRGHPERLNPAIRARPRDVSVVVWLGGRARRVASPALGSRRRLGAMIPASFDYVRPADIGSVLQILKERAGEAKLLAGGYSLLPLLKLRLASPALLIDLRDVPGLSGIRRTDDDIRIGGRATHRAILEDEGLARSLPLMREAASGIRDPQVRNWGTIAGSVAHADPNSDWPAVLLGLRATLVLQSADGERVVPARGFFLDPFVTGIEPTEVLTEVRIPLPGPRSGSAYQKLERRAGDFSTVGSAVSMSLDGEGRIASIG